jgi:hypothetical protein
MTATHIHEITDEMIQARLDDVVGASIEWTGRMPRDCESYDQPACDAALALTISDVREALGHELSGETAVEELDMAISIASEPADLPDNGCVVVRYTE